MNAGLGVLPSFLWVFSGLELPGSEGTEQDGGLWG